MGSRKYKYDKLSNFIIIIKPSSDINYTAIFISEGYLHDRDASPNESKHYKTMLEKGRELTLKQVYPMEYHRAQCASKDSIIHEILQFTLLITFHCVLHRCKSLEICCRKFYFIFKTQNSDNIFHNKF